ncbi:SGNH hydrolase-type esterase domain-containing protein [Aspergillus granulosus]|uniref:SGNH hydrolase-type esterase domain-containing protein n=1 Tax=Aspergillus granulosus TaxID=176169 RepID=A0ABR4HR83_9EURO
MPLGGSITYGVGSSDGNGYRKILQDMLISRDYPTEMVGSRNSGSMTNNANEGWRGRRIDQIQDKAIRSTTRLLPNVFTVNAGSNDCLQDFEIDSAGARLDALLEDLWAIGLPDATVILSTLLVAADDTTNERVLRVNEQIRELVAKKGSTKGKNIVLADMYSNAGGPQLGDLVDDGIHPNDGGYVKMARIWADSIDKAVGAEEVAKTVKALVAAKDINLSMKGGGYMHWAGAAGIVDGITVDLGLMNGTSYSAETSPYYLHL